MKKNIALILLLLITASSCSVFQRSANQKNARYNSYSQNSSDRPYVVVLSCDGFRNDYIERYSTPNLDAMIARGTRSAFIPCFPTVTFPNHYSMATGLYPQNHGLIGNRFVNKETGRRYSLGDRKAVEDPTFYKGEPIWNTAERQGVRTASYFWVGSETAVGGKQPSTWHKYDGRVPYVNRVDSVIAWLSKPESVRPHLIMWYLDEPDHTGHGFGPMAPETEKQVMRVDSTIGDFIHKLKALPIADKVNFIVVADHGMAGYTHENSVNLNDYLDYSRCTDVVDGVPTFISVQPDYLDEAMEILKNVPHVTAYKKGELPERLHFNDNPNISDIVVVPDIGSYIYFRKNAPQRNGGAHGYDNKAVEMRAVFIAEGPAFKSGQKVAPVPNITLYPLICRILGIVPAHNDANEADVDRLMK